MSKQNRAATRPGQYVESSRVAPLIVAAAEKFDDDTNGFEIIAERAGSSERHLRRIIAGGSTKVGSSGSIVSAGGDSVSIEYLDRLLIALGCHEILYREPTNETRSDGFADVYFHEAIVGEQDSVEIRAWLAGVDLSKLAGVLAPEAVAA